LGAQGSKAWTQLGLDGLGRLATPLADCGPEELWRGELTLLLSRHRFLEAQIREVEATLDGMAERSAAVQLLTTVPGVGVRTAEVIAAHLHAGRRFRERTR